MSGRLRTISPPPGLDARTVQHVAIRYTGYTQFVSDSVNVITGLERVERKLNVTFWILPQENPIIIIGLEKFVTRRLKISLDS